MGKNKQIPLPKKLKKDPGVPKITAMRSKAEAMAIKQKTKVDPHKMDIVPSISTLASLGTEGIDIEQDDSSEILASKTQKRQYLKTLHKVVEQSDVIIMVLDARDPEGCRSKLVEDEVRRREGDGKKFVFVLNKIDLVPKENAQAWLKYLRHTAPTLPFRASTQQQRNHLVSKTAPALLNLVKGYKTPNSSIVVGVVGYPNVGKSSLINSLKRAKVCPVAAEPGWTKEVQSVAVEKGFRILDSPGVIFDDPSQTESNILLRNVLKPEDIADPLPVILQIISRTSAETLQKLYKLPEFDESDPTEFLTMLALTTGRLGPGGVPDLEAAARQLMKDWNSAKIPFFSTPPAFHPSVLPSSVPGGENVGDTKIVSSWAPAFDLGGLFGAADEDAWKEDEEDAMQEDGPESGGDLQGDLLSNVITRKRKHSPEMDEQLPTSALSLMPLDDDSPPRTKRIKRSHSHIMHVDNHELSNMANSNPMSRKALRERAKKNRKAVSRAAKILPSEDIPMDGSIPEIGGVFSGAAFTFQASFDGTVSIH